jgi:hypothetical protein
MIRIAVTPQASNDVYRLLVQKERELRARKKGTLHRRGSARAGKARWAHTSFPGRILLQRCLGGVCVALIKSAKPNDEWQLLRSFIGFLDRHFRQQISGVTLTYVTAGRK